MLQTIFTFLGIGTVPIAYTFFVQLGLWFFFLTYSFDSLSEYEGKPVGFIIWSLTIWICLFVAPIGLATDFQKLILTIQ